MIANRERLRELVLRNRSWTTTGATLNGKINDAINDALQRVAQEIPDSLTPQTVSVRLLPDVRSDALPTASGGIATGVKARWVTADRRVLVLVFGNTTWTPDVTGIWDGIYWIELTHEDTGVVLRRQCRTFMYPSAGNGYIVVDDPLPDVLSYTVSTDNEFTWRLYQPEFWLHADVIRVADNVRIRDPQNRYDHVKMLPAEDGRRLIESIHTQTTLGAPACLFPGRVFQMPHPRRAPAAVVANTPIGGSAPPWLGPTYSGTFQIRYTYVWGCRDPRLGVSKDGTLDPMWESAPSAPSATFTVDATAFRLTASNVDAMWGFDETGATFSDHSGYRIRFYVSRASVSGATGDTAHNLVDSAVESFVFLAEVDPTDLVDSIPASYLWEGKTPDPQRPLQHSAGYRAWHVYPRQNQEYTLDVDCFRRPLPMLHDADAPLIQPGYIDALVELATSKAALLDGNDIAASEAHMRRFEREAGRLRAGTVSLAPMLPDAFGHPRSRQRYTRLNS